jgi:hypothetical protein
MTEMMEDEQFWLTALFTRAEGYAAAAIKCLSVGDLTGTERAGKLAKASLDEAVSSVIRKQDGHEIV